MTGSPGIDYGRGVTNIDAETGIRYGLISSCTLGASWYETAEPVYPEFSAEEIRQNLREGDEHTEAEIEAMTDDELQELASDWDLECTGSEYAEEGYQMHESGDSGFGVWVTASPFYTLCRYCSPCAPGAGDLDSPTPEGVKTYAPGHDWFEGGRAPYPVYSVATGELVEPEAE